MRKKSQAAKHGGNAELSATGAHESTMMTSERPEGTNPSLKKVKSPLASRSSSKKKMNGFSVRRSERIQNYVPQNLKIQSVIEEITLSESDSESDEEDELPTAHEQSSELPTAHEQSLPPPDRENDWPELIMGERKLEGKIDYIVKLLETQGHTLESIKTEVIRRSFSTETVPTTDMNYKSLYIASQKKIEELAEENQVLTIKLEKALGLFEAYKNGNRDAFEMLEKLKDVILISNGLRVSESTQATSQAELDKVTSLDVRPSSKRKKLTKQN